VGDGRIRHPAAAASTILAPQHQPLRAGAGPHDLLQFARRLAVRVTLITEECRRDRPEQLMFAPSSLSRSSPGAARRLEDMPAPSKRLKDQCR
jgi:hypothetical protein